MTGLRQGAYAENCVIAASHYTALKPAALSFSEAVALPFGGGTALHFLKKARLLVQGKICPVIDKMYLADALPEAHRYCETGRKRGAVVVN